MDPQYAVRAAAREAALARYGLAKTAGVLGTLGSVAKNVAIGDPVGTWEQFQGLRRAHGALGAYGRMLKDYHWTPRKPGEWSPYLWRALGTAAMGADLYGAITGGPNERAANLAGIAAGALAGPVTGSLGVLGVNYAHNAVVNLARRAGHVLDPKPDAAIDDIHTRVRSYRPTIGALAHVDYASPLDPGDLP